MNIYQHMVNEFHEQTDSTVGLTPALRDNALRVSLILEEAAETCAALGFHTRVIAVDPEDPTAEPIVDLERHSDGPNFVEVIDGLCDLVYVTLGTAVAAGIDLDPYFTEVHRSNMDKLRGKKRPDGKQLKPLGWTAPDIAGLLDRDLADAKIWQGLLQDTAADPMSDLEVLG